MGMDLDNIIVKKTSRRVLVARGAKLAYAAPVVAATAALNGAPVMAASPPCGQNVRTTFSVNCTTTTQLCSPSHDESVCSVTGNMSAAFTASSGHCSSISVMFFVDNVAASGLIGPLGPGAGTGEVPIATTPGSHVVSIQATGILGGCNGGFLQSWAGDLSITVN